MKASQMATSSGVVLLCSFWCQSCHHHRECESCKDAFKPTICRSSQIEKLTLPHLLSSCTSNIRCLKGLKA